MHYIHLIFLSDLLYVLNSARKFPTKNQYFSKHILFSTIYLLQNQKLNASNYSKQEIIMGIFLWSTDHEMNMHTKFQGIDMYVFL
jgi:hypothetical protein